MIQPNELRIGNHIEQGKIFEIKQNVIRVKYNGRTSLLVFEELKPIPLTEEILLKCGFYKEVCKPSEKHSNYYSVSIEDYKYSFSYASFRDDWGFYHSYTDSLNEEDNNIYHAVSFGLKHLHQLQNLYFALTGSELTIKI